MWPEAHLRASRKVSVHLQRIGIFLGTLFVGRLLVVSTEKGIQISLKLTRSLEIIRI